MELRELGTGANCTVISATAATRRVQKSYGWKPTVEIMARDRGARGRRDKSAEEELGEQEGGEEVSMPRMGPQTEPEEPPRLNESSTSSWVADVRIGKRGDGTLQWEPVRLQLEVAQEDGFAARRQLAQHFTAALVAQPFKWSGTGVVVLDIMLNEGKAKAIYDPGCVGVAISRWFAWRNKMSIDETVTMTILGSEGASTVDRGVFNQVKVVWEDTSVNLPAVVLPLVGFDCLLGMSWIRSVGANLDVDKGCIRCNGKEYFYQSLSIPAPEETEGKVALYAYNQVVIRPQTFEKVEVVPFYQGKWGGMQVATLAQNLVAEVPVYQASQTSGEVADWKVWNANSSEVVIMPGQLIGEWIPAIGEGEQPNKNALIYAYVTIPFLELTHLIPPGCSLTRDLSLLLFKWAQCFSIDKYDVGRTGPEYTIKLLTGKPYKGYVPRRSPAAIAAIREEVKKMLRADLIEESHSPYSAPMVCVPKPDGNIRVCIDFRMVNNDVVNDAYPMHRIEDQLDAMTGCQYFTTLDLTKGYHQLMISKESREVTAFSTPDGLFQWKVLPLGMKTSGAVFQRVMDQVFDGLQPKIVVVYIDDVTVFSPTLEQHLKDLEQVFERIHQAGLKVSYAKCKLAQEEILVLGHHISKKGIRPNESKVQAISQMKPPTTIKGVKSFMGALMFFQRFIPDMASIAEPLWGLCRKRVAFVWGKAQQEAFEKLKEKLTKAPILRLPQWELPFTIETDASGTGLGALLTQGEGEQVWPIAYASRILKDAETRYSATEREGLAVVWAVGKFKSYVMGSPFVVITDHAPLKALRTKANLEGRLLSFAEKLASYDYDVVYRPGKDNVVADLLSRAMMAVPQNYEEDSEGQAEAYRRNRIYILPQHREQVVRDLHVKFGGHFRFQKLIAAVKSRYYWPKMYKEVEKILRECLQCAKFSLGARKYPLRPMESSYPFEKVALDTGHVTMPSGKKEYFLVAVDLFTKWIEVKAVQKENGYQIATFIEECLVMRHGCPELIISDQGPPYASQEVRDMCTKWNIPHSFASTYHPESNGLVERTIGTLKRATERIADGVLTNWRTHMAYAVMAYRLMPHSTTGFSPFKMIYGREALLSDEVGLSQFQNWESCEEAVEAHGKLIWEMYAQARSKAQMVRCVRQSKWNARNRFRMNPMFKVGDLVWFDHRRMLKTTRRGLQRWIGPFRISGVSPGPNFQLRGVGEVVGRELTRVHPQFLKPFLGQMTLRLG